MKKAYSITMFLSLAALLTAQQPQLIIPAGHAESITACSFSENEQYLASADKSGRIILWDIASGRELQHFTSSIELTGLALSPDNRLIAGCSRDCTIEVWEISSGQSIWKNKVEFTRILSLSFSPDGAQLLSETDNQHFQVWEAGSGRQLRELKGSCADFQQNPNQLIAGTDALYLMDTHSGQKQLLYSGEDTIRQARFRSEAELSLLTDTEALDYDVRKKKVIRRFSVVLNDENGSALSPWKTWITPDGSQVFQFYRLPSSNTLRQWDIESGRLLREQKFIEDGPADAPYIQTYPSPGGMLLVSTLQDWSIGTPGSLWFTDGRTGKRQAEISARGFYHHAALSPQGLRLYLSSAYMEQAENKTEIWQLDGLKLLSEQEVDGRSSFQFTRHENISFWESAYDNGTLSWKNHATGDTLWNVNTEPDTYWWGEYANTAFDLDDSGKGLVVGAPGGKLLLLEADRPDSLHWAASVEGQRIDWVRFSGQGEKVVSYTGGRLQGWRIPPPPAALQPSSPSRPELVFETALPGFGPAACWANPTNERILAARQTDRGQISLSELNTLNGELKQFRTIQMDALSTTNRIQSLEITPDGKHLIAHSSFGMQDYLGESMGKTAYSATIWSIGSGERLASFQELEKPLIGLSPDGQYAFLLRSNSVQIMDIARDNLALSFIPLGKADWAVVAPLGLFDASPGAMELMYFTLGLETIELEQLKERYYEPGLMQKLLGFSDEPIRSVEGFDTIALYPTVSLQLDTLTHQLQIGLAPRNGGLGKVSVFVNGKEVIEDANPPQGFDKKRSTSLNVNLALYRRYFLQDSLNTVSVRAYNERGWLKSPAFTAAYRPRFASARGTTDNTAPAFSFQATPDPALYAIIVGTANYAGTKLDLKFPGKDAEAMASAIQQAGGQLFGEEVHIRLLTTDTANVGMHPTKANIKAVFEDFKEKAKAEDILLLYLSGHGVTYGDAERAQFYYLTQDISSEDLSDEGVRDTRAISSAELTKWINDIPAQKQVMILDACNSGKVVEALESGTKSLNSTQVRALDRMKDRTGMFVLAGSAADKVSYEASQYGQGLLTYSLLEWMKYRALEGDSTVDVVRLFEYARDRVPKLASEIGGIQTPTMATPNSGGFAVGLINERVEIPLPQMKPVFIRNVFQNEDSFDDELGLGQALADYFRNVTAKGAQAELIYVDVSKYKNAYSLKGLYGVAGDAVTVRARLFKGKTVVGEAFTVTGKKEEAPRLVEAIMVQVDGMLK